MACVFPSKLQVRPNVQLLRQGIPGENCGVAVPCFFSPWESLANGSLLVTGARWFLIPRIPLWKGLLLGCAPRIPNHRAPNQQLTISWNLRVNTFSKCHPRPIFIWPYEDLKDLLARIILLYHQPPTPYQDVISLGGGGRWQSGCGHFP